jgi:hypothetical protein
MHASYGKRGIIASGVRVTQGVFWSGWDGFDYLENPDFFALMQDAYDTGSEVCPHNTSEKMELPPEQVRRNMERYAKHFGLSTWIDHWRLPSNLTQKGMDPESEYYILDYFKQLGGKSAWTYRDVFANPPGPQINLLNPPRVHQYAWRLLRDLPKLRNGRDSANRLRAYFGALALLMIGAEAAGNLAIIKKTFRGFGDQTQLHEMSFLFKNMSRHVQHLLRSGIIAQFPISWDEVSGLYWFDAARIVFLSNAYNASALDNLIDETGIHIGHTYLGFYGRKYSDCAFRRDRQDFTIQDEFQEFLDYLAVKIRQGIVWNPTMREMIRYYEALAAVELKEDRRGQWCLTNSATTPVAGVTLRSLLPLRLLGDNKAREYHVGQEHWYIVDLAPKSELTFTVPHTHSESSL